MTKKYPTTEAYRKLLISIAIFLIVKGLEFAFRVKPQIYEAVYEHALFRWIRVGYDSLVGSWLPFPLWWIAIPFLLYVGVFRHTLKNGILHFLVRMLSSLFMIWSCFYLFWGWNYAQPGIEKRLNWSELKVDSLALYDEMDNVAMQIKELRNILQEDSLVLKYEVQDKNTLESEVREAVKFAFLKLNLAHYGNPRIRALRPKGVLLRLKTAGIYFPYAFEGHIDAGLAQIEWPFTMAHEMSHGFGIGNEGECNFLAYVACMESNNPYFQYSALLDYSLYVLRDVYRVNKEKYKYYISLLPKGYRADIQFIRENNAKYPDILPELRDFMYDQYLKSHGVQGGLSSYSQMVRLVMQYKLEGRG